MSLFRSILPHILCLLCIASGLRAQDSLLLSVKKVRTDLEVPGRYERRVRSAFTGVKDSVGMRMAANAAATYLGDQGYLELSFEDYEVKDEKLMLSFYQGPRYFYRGIRLEGLNEVEYRKNGFEKLVQKRRPVSWRDLERRLSLSLDEYQDNGYPFARFDSLEAGFEQKGDSVLTDLRYRFDPGKLVIVDTIIIEGEVREKDDFIRRLGGLRAGDPYSQEAVDGAMRSLNNSPYFKGTPPATVAFKDDKASITLKPQPRKGGRFDLLLGLLPPREDGGQFQFTGLIDFQLVSPLFRAGEIASLRFDKLTGSSQKLKMAYSHPYLFGTPVKGEFEFDFLKQDTVFQKRFLRLNAWYEISRDLSVKAWFRTRSSSLISVKAYLADTTLVPPVLDADDDMYGIGFTFDRLDYRYNPRRGWFIEADFGIGRKKIRQNPKLAESIYSDLQLTLPKAEAEFYLSYYVPLSKRFILKLANRSYWLDQEQYFENDLLQVGGAQSLRGFNENEFFTDLFSQFTVEQRFILERNSYLFVFSDYAYLQNQTAEDRVIQPWGLGIGITYETRAGMVQLTYAAGKVSDIPFQPSRGRIHVGLINQF